MTTKWETYQYTTEKKLVLANWLLQTEKVWLLTNSHEYELATAKSMDTSYKILKRMGRDKNWQDIRRKLEEVYSTNCAKSTYSQWFTQKTVIRQNIQNFMDLTEKDLGVDPAPITNWVILFLFSRNLYNKDIRWRVAGAKAISIIVNAFKLTCHSLLKIKIGI